MFKQLACFFIIFLLVCSRVYAVSEVLPETNSKVVVRDHPRTSRPYTVITSDSSIDLFAKLPVLTKSRPDYRMLDPKIKSGKIPYEGPVSDRKKVYVFAASVATLGAVGGTVLLAAAPAATGAAASGTGAGAYGLAATALASGAATEAWLQTRPNPNKDKIEQAFSSHQIVNGEMQVKK